MVVRATKAGGMLETLLSYAPTTGGRAGHGELFATLFLSAIIGGLAAKVTNLHTDDLKLTSNILLGLLIALPIFSVVLRRLRDVGRDASSLVVLLAPYIGVFILIYYLLRPSIYDDE